MQIQRICLSLRTIKSKPLIKILSSLVDIELFQNQDGIEPIGLVPTMGALHQGHMSLVEQALSENKSVVVSIFVNPTQFDNPKDLEAYPRTFKNDISLLESLNDKNIYVFTPKVDVMYSDKVVSEKFDFEGLENQMEGAFRKGHFNGVGTIVKSLFELIKPNKAYFGEKDFQQLQIIKKLVEIYDIPVDIVPCKIVRESDGLAMSSRNSRLSKPHRQVASFIYKTIAEAKNKFGTKSANKVIEWVQKEFEKQPLLKLEYFTIADENTLTPIVRKSKDKSYRAFIAVYAGEIRLIDNISLK